MVASWMCSTLGKTCDPGALNFRMGSCTTKKNLGRIFGSVPQGKKCHQGALNFRPGHEQQKRSLEQNFEHGERSVIQGPSAFVSVMNNKNGGNEEEKEEAEDHGRPPGQNEQTDADQTSTEEGGKGPFDPRKRRYTAYPLDTSPPTS